MDTFKTSLAPALVALVVSFGAYMVFTPDDGKPGRNGNDGQSLGALTGPDIPSPYLQWGGVRMWNYSDDMAVASTTCSFLTPASTSTLAFAYAAVDHSSYGATLLYEWGKATNAYATTTGFGTDTLGSRAQGIISASTTITNLSDNEIVFAPSVYLNFKVGSNTPTTLTGNCYAQFIEVI